MDWASVVVGAFLGVAGVFGLTSLALFPLMRRSFLLWNAGRTASFCIIALSLVPGNSAHSTEVANDVGVALSAACAGPFLISYLERAIGLSAIIARLRWVLPLGAAAALSTLVGILWPAADALHDVLLLAVIVLVAHALRSAIRQGSRAALFQAFAWGPLILVGIAELSYELATAREYWLWPVAVLIAVAVDFVVTSLGLIDGFMVIKRERDLAIADVREATRASTLDPLTGVANRRGLDQRFSDPAFGRPRALALIDCDHFKRINDQYGHDLGDEVLIAVAEALQGEDVFVGRLGGEEFVALLYREDWTALAEEARQRIPLGVRSRSPEPVFSVTASAGVYEIRDTDTLRSAITRADQALYAAKHAGRDRSVVFAASEVPPVKVVASAR